MVHETTQPGRPLVARWLVRTLWASLAVVVLLLFALAVVLLVKSHVLSARSLTGGQTKSLWAFLGVAFGAVVTLIGALLTEQHNRRTDALTQQTADREQAAREQQQLLARETEDRLKVDTVTKVLELVTIQGGGDYAKRARVAGAIATLMQLGGGVIGLRILNELWTEEAIDTDTAVWLIDRILQDRSAPAEDVVQAADLLATHAQSLVPKEDDADQDVMYWPNAIKEFWPSELPEDAKNGIFLTVIRILLARDITWWQRLGSGLIPIDLLINALSDGDWKEGAARTLNILCDADAFNKLGYEINDQTIEQIKALSPSADVNPWGDVLLAQLGQWAADQPHSLPGVTSSVRPIRPPSA